MKATFIFLLCICLMNCGHPNIADKIADGQTYNCVLMEKYKDAMPCGIFKIAEGLKFKIADTGDEFVALIACPALYGNEFFTKGNKYSLQLTSDLKKCENCQIYNSYQNSSLPTYFALKVSKID